MKKMLFVVLAVSAVLLILSGIHAQENPDPKPKVKDIKNLGEALKVDPSKKYAIKFEFADGMSFVRTLTKESYSENTLIDVNGTVKRVIPSNKYNSESVSKFSILKTGNKKIKIFRIELPEYTVKYGRSIFSNTFAESALKYKNQWVNVDRSNSDECKVVKYSPELDSLVADEAKMYKGMRANRMKFVGGGSKDMIDKMEFEVRNMYSPNTIYLDQLAKNLIVPDYMPEKSVIVGESWEIISVKQENLKSVENKLSDFLGGLDFSDHKVVFKLEEVKKQEDIEYAILSFNYEMKNSISFEGKRQFTVSGKVIHNLTRNRIKSITVSNKFLSEAENKAFGMYKKESESKRTFEYKYDE